MSSQPKHFAALITIGLILFNVTTIRPAMPGTDAVIRCTFQPISYLSREWMVQSFMITKSTQKGDQMDVHMTERFVPKYMIITYTIDETWNISSAMYSRRADITTSIDRQTGRAAICQSGLCAYGTCESVNR
jgi:hypothetical protein